ncbi:hypothetical protein [Acinetobacter junii]|uniref:hypothetical protein n=1 Tax=Acinetobacter junii TaxID=40215 RepID=UPI000F66100E|nr:hypothetical protein [Acinetobacter junii]QXR27003.1 hypothetical protein EGT69_011995 [Acinetobacter junii]
MNNYKIKVNNEAESKEAQELFFELGYKFEFCADIQSCRQSEAFRFPYFVQATEFGQILFAIGNLDKAQELTLPQLRDLVVLHRNDMKDATHVTEDNEVYYLKTSVWNVWKSGWHHSENDESWFEDNVIPIKKSEQGLISGADALRALADGKEVENWNGSVWWDVDKTWQVGAFMADRKFRLKPRNINLSLEIPAPFEPKDGDMVWCLDGDTLNGYKKVICDDFIDSGIGFWRTEEEIKQVVAALRGGIKG